MTDYLALCARLEENELVAAECENLTGGRPEADGLAFCQSIELVGRGAYVHTGLHLIAHGETLDDLLQAVKGISFPAEHFRIETMHLASQKLVNSRQAAIQLANVIPAYPDLDHPQHRFLLIERDSGLWLGEILVESTHSYRQHDRKPYRTSASLPSRLARALVNLVVPPARTILDPCCGTGSILLEAHAIGVDACGVDWSRRMVGIARKNLEHFNYATNVIYADIRDEKRTADAIITDLPYGLFMHESPVIIREIIQHTLPMAPVAVFVAGEDMSDKLREVGYADIEVLRIRKQKRFNRYVHRARSGAF